MAVGTGIECINLKKAKYNRDMRMAAEAAKAAKAVKVASAHTYYEPVPEARTRAVSKKAVPERVRSARRGTAVDDGYTFKDVAGAIGEELLGAFASYRRKKARERARAPKYIAKRVKAKTAFPVSVIGYMVVFSVIAMFLVLGNSRINEATLQISSIEQQIEESVNNCEMMTAELNSRSDAAEIEEYAVNVLGLVKNTDVAKTYVSISGEDKIVVNGEAQNVTP